MFLVPLVCTTFTRFSYILCSDFTIRLISKLQAKKKGGEKRKKMESVDSRDEEAPLVADSLQVLTPKNYTRDVHILSCAFLLIFLAYGAAQNLETTVNTVE